MLFKLLFPYRLSFALPENPDVCNKEILNKKLIIYGAGKV